MKTRTPANLVRRHDLSSAALTAQSLRSPRPQSEPAVFILPPSAKAREAAKLEAIKTTAELLARIHALEAEKAEMVNRAHREERVKAITCRVVDNRTPWRAKMGCRGAQATSTIITTQAMRVVDYLPNVAE